MISGVHAIIYSADPEADRRFFRDVLNLTHVDAGEGWLIFGLPPAEIAVHPADMSGAQAVYLLSDDIKAFVEEMEKHDISHTPIQSQRWGLLTRVTLPGGGQIGVYQPRHVRPKPIMIRAKSREHQKPVTRRSTGQSQKKPRNRS